MVGKFHGWLALAWLLGSIGILTAQDAPESTFPDIVLLVANDLGWGDLARHGNRDHETPFMDRMEEEGATMLHHFSEPLNAPAQACLLTGRHFLRTGVSDDAQAAHLLHPAEITVAELLHDHGYRCGFFGTWKLGLNFPHHPAGQGFQRWELEADPVEAALAFLEEDAFGPDFAVIWLDTPGTASGPEELATRVETIDDQLGLLLVRSEAEESVIIFTSDGGPRPFAESEAKRQNGYLFSPAGSLHEGALRVPCLFRWPDEIPAGLEIAEISHHVDFLATLTSLTGAGVPRDRDMDGISLKPLLRVEADTRWPNRNLNSARLVDRDLKDYSASVRNTRWRAVMDLDHRRTEVGVEGERWELYDVIVDPWQRDDLAEVYPFVLGRLKSDFSQWYRNAISFGLPIVPIEIGHPGWDEVTLSSSSALFDPQSGTWTWELLVVQEGEWRITQDGIPVSETKVLSTEGEEMFSTGEGRLALQPGFCSLRWTSEEERFTPLRLSRISSKD